MSNEVITSRNFTAGQRSINLSGFTNIEKSMDEGEFQLRIGQSNAFEIFTQEGLRKFVQDVNEKASEIVKGEGAESNREEILNGLYKELSGLCVMNVIKPDGTDYKMFYKAKPNSDEIQKGELAWALSGSNFTFKKTGKQIKEKLAAGKDLIEDRIQDYDSKLEDIDEEIVDLTPTEPVSSYTQKGIEKFMKGYKMFHYCQTYYSTDSNKNESYAQYSDNAGKSLKPAESKEQAMLCSKHNSLIYEIADCYKDLQAVNTIIDNLEDTKTYELNANQLTQFGF